MSSPPNSAAPRWQRRPEARPEEILDAAWAVFAEQGFARAKLDDVARRAGVSKGTLYLYFDSKETLFREVVRSKVVSTVIEGEELVRGFSGSSRQLLAMLIARLYHLMRDDGKVRLVRLVHSELPNFPELARFYFDEVILRTRHLLEAVIRRGIEAGEFRPVSPEFVARGIPAMIIHFSALQCFFADFDPYRPSSDEVVQAMTDLSLNGVLADRGEARA